MIVRGSIEVGAFWPCPYPSDASAAPHLPAGILSPYSDGERGALASDFANSSTARDKRLRIDYMNLMINLTATYWYFRSSLAAGGLRSI
ncbi:hypothetical protein EOD10_28910 [Mesorhizobium sp. M7A.T.Ca.TU.009.01.3.2]|nr:hypothetical protein EOD10_28910 [Mesorhizobium sp. M7A.T.Ca.TU.009.01.3.2]RUU77383.1 hypothetical protein EOC06_23790 [Mesorhizobium sp. M7A.F.Ca.MR.362.00.0.0]RUV05677.1 hypothetical protein EOD00_21140 [Mesorhizobium sp. M7A.T.Ca.TU.009.01.3.1]RWN97163.1 MAG: hypothetical protein EOS05_04285 [Mesorhizobium sp.]